MSARRITKAIVGLGAGVLLTLAMPSVAFAAGTGYTPAPAPAGTGTPGGFNSVVTTVTIQPSGGTITVTIGGETITITIPPGTFTEPVQVVVTSGDAAQIGSAGTAGYTAINAFGISFMVNGQKFTGTFGASVSVNVSGNLASSDKIVVYDPSTSTWVGVAGATNANGSIGFTITSDSNFAVLASTSSTVSGATSATTGKPFLLEGILAALLVVLGGLATWRFARAPRQA